MKIAENRKVFDFNKNLPIVFLAGIFVVISAILLLSYYEHLLFEFFVMGIIFVLAAIYISKKHIDQAILFLIFWIAFEPFLLKFIPQSLYVFLKYGPELLIYVLLAIVLYKNIAKQKKVQFIFTPINVLFVAFIIISFISILLNDVSAYVGILGVRQMIRFVFLFYLIIYANIQREKIKVLLYAMFILVLIESALAIAQFATFGALDSFLLPDVGVSIGSEIFLDGVEQFWEVGQRVFATFGRYDKLGSFLCLAFLGLLGFLMENKYSHGKKALLITTLMLVGISILLTYSRACWLATLAGSVVLGIVIKRNKKFMAALACLFVSLLIYTGYYIVTTQTNVSIMTDFPQLSIMERFLQTFSKANLASDYEGIGRLYFIVNTPLKVVANYPFFGVGPGQYGGGVAAALGNKTKYYELGLPFGVFGELGQIDNNWLSIWGETGTLGLLIFGFIFWRLYKSAGKIYRFTKDSLLKPLSFSLQGMVAAVCVLGFFGPYFELRTLMFYFWLLAGLVFYLHNLELKKYKIK